MSIRRHIWKKGYCRWWRRLQYYGRNTCFAANIFGQMHRLSLSSSRILVAVDVWQRRRQQAGLISLSLPRRSSSRRRREVIDSSSASGRRLKKVQFSRGSSRIRHHLFHSSFHSGQCCPGRTWLCNNRLKDPSRRARDGSGGRSRRAPNSCQFVVRRRPVNM